MTINDFRFDNTDSVYVWMNEQQAYIFCGVLNGRSKFGFVSDYTEMQNISSHQYVNGEY